MNSNENSTINLEPLERAYYNKQTVGVLHASDEFDFYFSACQHVAESLKMILKKPQVKPNAKFGHMDYLKKIAEANQIYLRKIQLKHGWEKQDLGSFVGFYQGKAVALLYQKSGGYKFVNVAEETSSSLTEEIAKNIDAEAFVFYPALPNKKLSLKDILQFTIADVKKEFFKILFLQITMSLLFLLIPIITGIIFDNVIQNANISLLLQFTIILAINILVITLMNVSQDIALLRLRIKTEHKLQAGIWDRLLRLPLTFFKQYTAGDLAYRTGNITEMQQLLSTNIILSIIKGGVSIISLGLMFYYSVYLSIAALVFVIIIIVTNIKLSLLTLKQEQRVIAQQSKITGLLFELVNSIIKLRVANRIKEGFQLWVKEFATATEAELSAGKYRIGFTVFTVGFVSLCTLLIYGLVILQGKSLSFGSFIVFNAAFMQFFAAILLMTTGINQCLEIIPLFNRAKPVFDALPEELENQAEPGEIDGHVILKNIVFRYDKDSKPLFKNFSLEILPGSFTAIAGPSGSGKSTIFRLLIGLEQPESGEIIYSGMNLKTLRVHTLRQQLGVVMQSTQLIPGTIFQNIAGQRYSLTREEAWEIADQVGIADMIHKLPMGMDTLINDGIQTLSGGETQRVNLARAIAAQPKILMLDEATSAMDNRVQQKVQDYLRKIKVTQIVIAHRFSTILHADVIHVIDQGRCIESGNYEELLSQKGTFYQLARRQLVE